MQPRDADRKLDELLDELSGGHSQKKAAAREALDDALKAYRGESRSVAKTRVALTNLCDTLRVAWRQAVGLPTVARTSFGEMRALKTALDGAERAHDQAQKLPNRVPDDAREALAREVARILKKEF
jgi:hypothetical protein